MDNLAAGNRRRSSVLNVPMGPNRRLSIRVENPLASLPPKVKEEDEMSMHDVGNFAPQGDEQKAAGAAA